MSEGDTLSLKRNTNFRKYYNTVRNKQNMKKISSPAGNRTPVSRVTGGDTYPYTTEDTNARPDNWIKLVCIK